MQIRFTEAPKGRDYKVGDVVDFNGHVAEGYARKYVNRGWAVEVDTRAEEKAARDAKAASDADAKAKADSDAKLKAEADARAKAVPVRK